MHEPLRPFLGQKQQTAPSPGGLEPPTFRLTAERANRLRHGDLCEIPMNFKQKFRSSSFCDVILTGSILFYLNNNNNNNNNKKLTGQLIIKNLEEQLEKSTIKFIRHLKFGVTGMDTILECRGSG